MCSLSILLCAIPVIIPENVSETRDTIVKYEIYNSSVCCFIVFNIGKTFGEAFDIAISGIKGTILAALMGWLLYTICPQGYEGHELGFWSASLISQIFAISNFAETLMTFVNTEAEVRLIPIYSPLVQPMELGDRHFDARFGLHRYWLCHCHGGNLALVSTAFADVCARESAAHESQHLPSYADDGGLLQ
eukprot:Skav225535  [mRNA]  locus=scaffold6394:3357:3926:+ [translate_table: standard]